MGNIEEKKLFTDKVEIKRALISVTDKSGIEILAKQLTQNNIEIFSQYTCKISTSFIDSECYMLFNVTIF